MLKIILNPLIYTVLLIVLYSLGALISDYFGSPQRGGVSWVLTIQSLIILFYIISLTQQILINKTTINKIKTTLVSSLALIVLSFLIAGNNFNGGGWAHPYRFSYYLACALALLLLPSIKQLTSKLRSFANRSLGL